MGIVEDQLKRDTKSSLKIQRGGSHYKNQKIQPIEYITANNLGFIEGCIVKYITRHKNKGGVEDIDKIIHYCELLKELTYEGEATNKYVNQGDLSNGYDFR